MPLTMPLEITWPPAAPGERYLSYKICPFFTYRILCWEVCIYFSDEGGGKFSAGGIIYGDNFPWEGSFQGVNFSGKIYTGGIC